MAENAALRRGVAWRHRENVKIGSADARGIHFQQHVVVSLNCRHGERFEAPLTGCTKHESFHGLRHLWVPRISATTLWASARSPLSCRCITRRRRVPKHAE